MGKVYQQKPGPGNIWSLDYYHHGRRIRQSTGCKSKTEALRLLHIAEGEAAKGKAPSVRYDKVRLDELAQNFLTDYAIKKNKSFKRAEQSAMRLEEFFKGWRVVEITTSAIQR